MENICLVLKMRVLGWFFTFEKRSAVVRLYNGLIVTVSPHYYAQIQNSGIYTLEKALKYVPLRSIIDNAYKMHNCTHESGSLPLVVYGCQVVIHEKNAFYKETPPNNPLFMEVANNCVKSCREEWLLFDYCAYKAARSVHDFRVHFI